MASCLEDEEIRKFFADEDMLSGSESDHDLDSGAADSSGFKACASHTHMLGFKHAKNPVTLETGWQKASDCGVPEDAGDSKIFRTS